MTARKVLIVEDNQNLLDLLAMVLNDMGHEVLRAQDGKEGLRLIEESNLDLGLIDVSLPGIDGVEIVKRVRSSPHLRDIPLIAMTGGPRGKEALKAGCCALLEKPFSHTPFRAVVEKTLAASAAS